MQLSELIAQLAQKMATEGDLEVKFHDTAELVASGEMGYKSPVDVGVEYDKYTKHHFVVIT